MGVLEQIKAALDDGQSKSELAELSSKFYSTIPHSFGRKTPPTISTQKGLQDKIDMLNVLSDIGVAQEMKETTEKIQEKEALENEVENPMDIQYAQLGNKIGVVDKNSDVYKTVQKYIASSSGGLKLKNLYTVERDGEKQRFDEHKDMDNRKLLWHGTSVCVVSAILKTGLRIMPHSGGRVGRGIYSASENSKSAGYVGRDSKGTGFMFLNEVVLGKEKHITEDDSSLKTAPKGFNSIIAQGRTEPDPQDDVKFGNVVVPCGKPKARPQYKSSMFDQTEYLVYQESQVNMKFLCMIDFGKGGW